MRSFRMLTAFLAVSAGLISGCSGTPDSGASASTAPSTASASSSSAAGSPPAGSATPSADTETSVPAPAPATSRPTAGPGQGNAEFAITVVPSEGAAELDYTLVCSAGTPAAESSHPNAAAACAALKASPAILAPAAPVNSQPCTQHRGRCCGGLLVRPDQRMRNQRMGWRQGRVGCRRWSLLSSCRQTTRGPGRMPTCNESADTQTPTSTGGQRGRNTRWRIFSSPITPKSPAS